MTQEAAKWWSKNLLSCDWLKFFILSSDWSESVSWGFWNLNQDFSAAISQIKWAKLEAHHSHQWRPENEFKLRTLHFTDHCWHILIKFHKFNRFSNMSPSCHNVWNIILKTTYPCFPLLSASDCENWLPMVIYEMSSLLLYCIYMTMALCLLILLKSRT